MSFTTSKIQFLQSQCSVMGGKNLFYNSHGCKWNIVVFVTEQTMDDVLDLIQYNQKMLKIHHCFKKSFSFDIIEL